MGSEDPKNVPKVSWLEAGSAGAQQAVQTRHDAATVELNTPQGPQPAAGPHLTIMTGPDAQLLCLLLRRRLSVKGVKVREQIGVLIEILQIAYRTAGCGVNRSFVIGKGVAIAVEVTELEQNST